MEITISPEGKVSLRVKGVKGRRCLDLTRELEEKLGTVVERRLTGDYYQTQVSGEVWNRS